MGKDGSLCKDAIREGWYSGIGEGERGRGREAEDGGGEERVGNEERGRRRREEGEEGCSERRNIAVGNESQIG